MVPVKMYADFKKSVQPLNLKIRDLPEFLVRALADRVPQACKNYAYDYRGE